ncbi:MAG: sugar ABC transporter permease [Lachnospiraceae bacterium]|jgi:multiple sugar transport system permease protein|nr:sugar ABC transporter permease [Lachnospiraceae bacterium]
MDGRKRRARSEFLWGWGMILPAIVGLIILNIIPIFQTIYQSFFKTGAFGRSYIFIGAQNYQKLIQDKDVFLATINTFQFVLLEVPVSIILALILAVLLNRPMKGRSAFRTIIFVPMVAAPAAVAMVWKWLLNSKFGLVNHFLNSIGLSSVDWLSDSKVALLSVAIVGIWSILGYNMVLFLAGLQEIPHDYYEASEIDGAGFWAQFFHITLPMISPTMFFVMITRIISAFQMFDFIYMLIGEQNPALPHTQTLVYLFYKHAFLQNNRGYGAAIVVYLLGIIMLITAFQMWAQKKWVYYA